MTLLLYEFNLTILENPRKHNVVAIFLSRLTNIADNEFVDDNFPNDNPFSISIENA